MKVTQSIRTKLFVILLFVSIVPIVLVGSILILKSNQGFNTVLENNLTTIKNTIAEQ